MLYRCYAITFFNSAVGPMFSVSSISMISCAGATSGGTIAIIGVVARA